MRNKGRSLSTGGIFLVVERFDGFAMRVCDRKGLSACEGRRDSCDLDLTVANHVTTITNVSMEAKLVM